MRDGELDAKRWIITEQKLWYSLRATATRGTVSLGAWFGFAFLAAVICELCGKEELNREERQGFAKEAKQVLGPKGQTETYPPADAFRASSAVDAKPAVILYSRMK